MGLGHAAQSMGNANPPRPRRPIRRHGLGSAAAKALTDLRHAASSLILAGNPMGVAAPLTIAGGEYATHGAIFFDVTGPFF